ncbi:MAG: PsiF family protein [Phyllobacterium sp.]|uniref:PsiF family protein n=1 Tax=Phyllobacterium sp. TaxID=1871046 RepID=UPI0030F17126
MRFVTAITTAAVLALMGTAAMAQTATPPTTPVTPMATSKSTGSMTKQKPVAPNTMTPAQSAVSKACSAQADAKGLHGKERSKFRSQCKKNGGKA